MPRIRLWTGPDPEPMVLPFAFPDGRPAEMTNGRLYCRVYAGRDLRGHEAVVDTGAPSVVFPFRVWQRFERQIRWVSFASPPAMRRGAIGSRSYSFRLGVISVQLSGWSSDPRLPTLEVIAQFEQPDPTKALEERLTHTIVGMQFGPLEGRYLVVGPRQAHPERCEAWVTDERPVDPLVLASATL